MMEKASQPILIIGGTGVQGGNVARELLKHDYRVRVLSRNPQSAAAQEIAAKGAEIVQGDMADADSLAPAMKGVSAIFSAQYADPDDPSAEMRNAANMVKAAQKAGIEQVVHTSVAGSNTFPRWNKYKTLADYNEYKYQIEELVRNGGFRYWTILHPCLFMESFEEKSARVMAPELKDGILFGVLKPDTQIKWTCGDNTAQFARAAFEDPEKFSKKDINVAGDELSMYQAAQTLSRVLGKNVVYESVSHEEAVHRGLMEGTVCGQEWMEAVTPSFGFDINETRKYGVPLTSLEMWAATHRANIFIHNK